MTVGDVAFIVYLTGIPLAIWSGLDAERKLLPLEDRRPLSTALLSVLWPLTVVYGFYLLWQESGGKSDNSPAQGQERDSNGFLPSCPEACPGCCACVERR